MGITIDAYLLQLQTSCYGYSSTPMVSVGYCMLLPLASSTSSSLCLVYSSIGGAGCL